MTALRDFEELRVRVRRIGAERYLILANGGAQSVRATRIGADAAILREEFNRLIAIETGNAPAGATDTLTGLRQLGRSVYDLLLDDAFATTVRQAREAADELGHGLRLRFDLPPALHALPVEALCAPAEQPEQTFALDAGLSIVRSLRAETGLGRHRMPAGQDESGVLHLLVAIATPNAPGLPELNAEKELAELRELPDFVVRTDVIGNATQADIQDWLAAHDKQPTAVLLIAHGSYAEHSGDGVVLLETPDRGVHRLPGHQLSGMLVRAQGLRLVVLNLCFGAWNSAREPFAGLAQAIVGKGIPAVVAMHGLVTDQAAGIFGARLLTQICANNSVDDAVTSARHHIANLSGHTAIEWATPMLFLHAACGHGWLFKAREVLGDGKWADPLLAGEQAYGQVQTDRGNIPLPTALMAARFLRLRGDWHRVESIAKAARPTAKQLVAEASWELAWPTVDGVCAALADADPVLARERLDKVLDPLPDELSRLLTDEISAAAAVDEQLDRARRAVADRDWQSAVDSYERIERDQPPGARHVAAELAAVRQEIVLADHYASLLAHHEAGHWEAALAECATILAAREGGYRDTAVWVDYLTARQAEAYARWPDAVRHYAACHGFADAPARLARAHGHVAVDLGDWPGAANHFHAATELGLDDDRLAGYATARAAERDGDWEMALGCYAALPDTLLDVGSRRRYAAGRRADARDDWTGVTTGFDSLLDDFADGEVGRLRQFARAGLAGERGDWDAVLGFLDAMPDEYRAGSVGVLRWTARGGLAEAADDWARAAECYVAVADGGELGLAQRYAAGRQREQEHDWAGALDRYGTLPSGHRDVQLRIGYGTARAAELGPDWVRAADLYMTLPADFADVPARLRYAQMCVAVAEDDWTTAEQLAQALGDHRDAVAVAAYARGRLAEGRADWADAIVAFRSCGAYADGVRRAEYATGRQLDDAGLWSRAQAAYARAAGIDPELQRRQERLGFLLAELPFAEGIAHATLVADPVALRDPTFPYPALADAGVTPASPAEVVADLMFALMERGMVSWQERVAWEQLRVPAKRLLVDARMFRLREPDVLGQRLATLTPAEQSPLSRLCAWLPADAPLLTLLAGDRAGAIALWRQRLADHPDDQHVVHCLALASFWHARELEETGAWERAASVWRTALACLATLLTNDEFWTGWWQDRASRCGHTVTPADIRMLRIEFGRYLVSELTGRAQRHADVGRAPEAERYQRLVTLFEAELAAAQCLDEIGGLPLRGGGPLSCGPEYVRLVDLSVEFGEFIAGLHKSDLDDTTQGQLSRLRCAFSVLSQASSLVDHHRFEAALRELPDYHRSGRAELPDDCAGPDRHGGVGVCPHCREFLRHNPAYTYLADRRVRLLGDAVGLAVRARLSIARELLTGHQLDAAMAELTGAIDIAANALIGARAQRAGLRIIAGRVAALAESDDGTITGVDEAIELAARAIPVFFGADRRTLVKKLADLLVDRGVWYGSVCYGFGLPTDLARAVGELRRACELDPDSTRVRYNLARGLIRYSESMPIFADRLALLIEAMRGISEGLDQAGLNGRLTRVLRLELERLGEALVAELSMADMHGLIQSFGVGPAADLTGADHARSLAEEGRRLRADGDLIQAAHLMVRAVRADPADWRYRDDLLATLEDLLTERRDGGSAHV